MVLSMAGRSTNGEFGVRRMLRPLPLPAEHRTHAVQPVTGQFDGIRSGLPKKVSEKRILYFLNAEHLKFGAAFWLNISN